jgi:hypothetical protein
MELTANTLQTVEEGANVQFTDEVVAGCNSILHRSGSGLTTLRGITAQCRARFKIFFSGNIAIPTGGTVEAISLAISINGEAVGSSTMIQTPAAVEEFSNVATAAYIDVPNGCCVTIAIKNTSTQAIEIQNANLIVERVA